MEIDGKPIDYSSILMPLSQNPKYYKFISFDVETYSNDNLFLFGSAYDGETFYEFNNKEDMIKFLINIHYPNTFLVATNLGFDFNAIFYGTKYFPKFDYIITNGKMLCAKWHFEDDYMHMNIFIDTMNFSLMGVDKLGQLLNCKKLKSPDYIGKIPKTELEWEYYREYNRRDSEITYKFMILMQTGINMLGGNFKFTISSTALDIYRRVYQKQSFIKEDYIINDNTLDIKKNIFDSYYGGRTEVFARGFIRNMKLYDINSLYPWAMTNEFPEPSSVKYIASPDNDVLNYEGISNVIVEAPNMFIPLLPYRDAKIKKLIFPIGKFIGTFTHIELNKAVNELNYKILKFNWSIIYTKSFEPFKDYVNDIYKKRIELKNQGSSLEGIYKLFLNALYGKFGQKSYNEIKFFDMTSISDKQYEELTASNNLTAYKDIAYATFKKESKSNFIFPIFCAYVTGYGRIRLYDYMIKYNSIYCDTDSIVTNKNIETSTRLGEMKLEANIREGIIVKPKFYTFDYGNKQIYKVKGVRGVDAISFNKLLNNEPVIYKKFIKLKEAIKNNILVNSIYEMQKIINLDDNKRIWAKDKFEPFEYDDDNKPYFKDILS